MQYLGILATVFGTNYAFWDRRNAFWDEITTFAA